MLRCRRAAGLLHVWTLRLSQNYLTAQSRKNQKNKCCFNRDLCDTFLDVNLSIIRFERVEDFFAGKP
jgi:hypothetical protein